MTTTARRMSAPTNLKTFTSPPPVAKSAEELGDSPAFECVENSFALRELYHAALDGRLEAVNSGLPGFAQGGLAPGAEGGAEVIIPTKGGSLERCRIAGL